MDVPKFVLDVTDCVFHLNAGLSIYLLLQHFGRCFWIVHKFFNLILAEISVDQLNLSCNFFLDCIFEILFKFLLLEQNLTDFFAEVEIKISFHAGLWLILNKRDVTGCFFSLSLTDI